MRRAFLFRPESARIARAASTLATGPTPCVWVLIGHWNHKNLRVHAGVPNYWGVGYRLLP